MKAKKNTPTLRFHEFKDDWAIRKVGELGNVVTGSTPATSNRNFYNGTYLFVSPGDIQENRYVIDTKTKITESALQKSRRVKKGSTLFVCIGSTIGKIAQAADDCITNQQINAVVPVDNYVADFVYSVLECHSSKIRMMAAEQAVPIINKSTFSNFSLLVPTFGEQQKIAKFLSFVDYKIQQLQKKKDLLEQYKKGVMQRIFNQEIQFKDDDGNDYPSWDEKALGDVSTVTMGQSPDSRSYNTTGKGIPLVQGNADITNRQTDPRNWTSEPTKKCIPGDLILTVRAPVGMIAKSIHHACLGRGVCSIKSTLGNSSDFLYQLLLWYEARWIGIQQGSTFTAVSGSEIKKVAFSIPSHSEQTKIANFLSVIDDKINLVNQQLEKIKQFKKGLLQQMFV